MRRPPALLLLRVRGRRFRKFPCVTQPRSLQSAWLRRRLARRPLRAVPALHGLLPTLPLVHQRSESPLRRGTADSALLGRPVERSVLATPKDAPHPPRTPCFSHAS